MKMLVSLAMLLLMIGCASTNNDAPLFHEEPMNQFTIGHSGTLAAGDTLHLSFVKLAPNDRFHVNRCGVPCNTSKVVYHVGGDELPKGERDYELAEGGEYYLWIQRSLPGGEVGPSHIDEFEAHGNLFRATFATGSVVSGELTHAP